jgi:uncharacterized membrane protein YfcA
MSLSAEIGRAFLKASPPVAVIGARIAGWGPQEWMYALTALYVAVQTVYLCWKWMREYRDSQKAPKP